MEQNTTPLPKIIIALLKTYRYLISPLLGPRCRFYPTCSHYAEQAFREYGFFSRILFNYEKTGSMSPSL